MFENKNKKQITIISHNDPSLGRAGGGGREVRVAGGGPAGLVGQSRPGHLAPRHQGSGPGRLPGSCQGGARRLLLPPPRPQARPRARPRPRRHREDQSGAR